MMRRMAAKYPEVTFLVGTGEACRRRPPRSATGPLPVDARRRSERRRPRDPRLRDAGLAPGRGGGRGISRRLGGRGRLRGGVPLAGRRDRRARLPVSALSRRTQPRRRGVMLGARMASPCSRRPPLPSRTSRGYASAVGEGARPEAVVSGPPLFDQSSRPPGNADLTGVVLGGDVRSIRRPIDGAYRASWSAPIRRFSPARPITTPRTRRHRDRGARFRA